MIYTFSILHPTARVPDGWRPAADAWLENCSRPQDVEYVLAVHESQRHALLCKELGFGLFHLVESHGRRCWVENSNAAAEASTGKFLVLSADDFFPPKDWDLGMLAAIPNIDAPCVLDLGTSDSIGQPGLIAFPTMTRAYYEQPGRGGCGGNFLYPEYVSMGADDDFTEYAHRDGAVVDARHLKFEHRHWSNGARPHDEVDDWQSGRPEVWEMKERVIARRRREGFVR
jgi:hypothetical protein